VKIFRFVPQTALILFILTTGCTRHIHLKYSETNNAPSHLTSANKSITLLTFLDQTNRNQNIGRLESATGIKWGSVIAQENVSDWITTAIERNLEKAGYQVIRREKMEQVDTNPVISGQILTVSADARITYNADVSFLVKIVHHEKTVLEKPYFGRGSAGLNWLARGRSFERSFSEALALAVANLMRDIRDLEQSGEL
jgi:hypothetical protein